MNAQNTTKPGNDPVGNIITLKNMPLVTPFSDWALDKWQINQDFKPDSGYSWSTVPGTNEVYFYTTASDTSQLIFPQNTYNIFSFITQARCYALGAQINVAGAFNTSLQVELDETPYNFLDTHKFSL
jgi:hypothetical protein